MSLWQSYRSLPSRTRLLIGMGVMGWAGFGIIMSNIAEKEFGLEPTQADKEKLDRALPKLRIVEKSEVGLDRTQDRSS
ncbi:MAG: hypothetical protein M1827_004018 [Pycnora praestabilis]|nr:MAG: hypothetical protein M1827_004018 [Pycnora praestabilis]